MTFRPYKSYNFKEKDPIIDRLRTAYEDALGRDSKLSYAEVQRRSDVSPSTMHQWFDGKTRRPQFSTVVAFARAIDCDIAVVKRDAKGNTQVMPLTKRSPVFDPDGKRDSDNVMVMRRKIGG